MNLILHAMSEMLDSRVKKALRVQLELRERCILQRERPTADITYIAGADAAYSADRVYASVVTIRSPGLEVIEEVLVCTRTGFPYIPGLLAFREGPALLKAIKMLRHKPDLVMFNAHGIAHPYRFGLASHLGVLLDIPTVGVARRLLTGEIATPVPDRAGAFPVIENGEWIAIALRVRKGGGLIFISAGHMTDLSQALEVVQSTITCHRLPEPLFFADRNSKALRAQHSQDFSKTSDSGER